VRRQYTSINSVLADLPSTTLLINATGIGSLNLTDIKDTNLYPTRGQTWLVSEPKAPITRMYEFERTNKYEARFRAFTHSFLHPPSYPTKLSKARANKRLTGTFAHPNASTQQPRTSSHAPLVVASFWAEVARNTTGVRSGMKSWARIL
jgi:hypothetical protein